MWSLSSLCEGLPSPQTSQHECCMSQVTIACLQGMESSSKQLPMLLQWKAFILFSLHDIDAYMSFTLLLQSLDSSSRRASHVSPTPSGPKAQPGLPQVSKPGCSVKSPAWAAGMCSLCGASPPTLESRRCLS